MKHEKSSLKKQRANLSRHVIVGEDRVDAAQHTGHVAVNVEQTQGLLNR